VDPRAQTCHLGCAIGLTQTEKLRSRSVWVRELCPGGMIAQSTRAIQCTIYSPNGPHWQKMILQKNVKNMKNTKKHVFRAFLKNQLSPIRSGEPTQVACLHTRVDLSIAYFIDQTDLIDQSSFCKKMPKTWKTLKNHFFAKSSFANEVRLGYKLCIG
jgi:hypothetical protein